MEEAHGRWVLCSVTCLCMCSSSFFRFPSPCSPFSSFLRSLDLALFLAWRGVNYSQYVAFYCAVRMFKAVGSTRSDYVQYRYAALSGDEYQRGVSCCWLDFMQQN